MGVNSDNWQETISLVGGAMVKEVVSSTLNTLYNAERINNQKFNTTNLNLSNKLDNTLYKTWQRLKKHFESEYVFYPDSN